MGPRVWAALVVLSAIVSGCTVRQGPATSSPLPAASNLPSAFASSEPTTSREPTFEEAAWERRIESSFEDLECPAPKPHDASLYAGPMVDSHFHVQSLPDSTPQPDREDDHGDASARSGLMGVDFTFDDFVCTFGYEGTKRALAFFAIYPDISDHAIELAQRAMARHPNHFIPFIMPPDGDNSPEGSPTVNATVLRRMLDVHPGLFEGYGEIGLYARPEGAAELPPDAPRLQEIYPLLRETGLASYFHLGTGHKDNYETVLEAHPDLRFIWHGDQLSVEEVEDIVAVHGNVWYTVDELYGDVWLLRNGVSREEFLAHFQDYEPLLEKDLATWKGVIERHPDQFMWGTDRGVTPWTVDAEVGWTLNDYGRAFIARLDPAVQEKFAYRNAERIFEDAGS